MIQCLCMTIGKASWVFAYFRNMYNSLYNSHVVNKDCIQSERHNAVYYEKLHVIELIHCLPYVRICAFEKIFVIKRGFKNQNLRSFYYRVYLLSLAYQ